jgi:RNA polymerase sigma-70 factor (ECF subfamily)
MPPFEMWLGSAADIGTWMLGPGSGCRDSRFVQTEANGCPAVAQYRPTADGGHTPWALHVLEIDGGRIRHITSFLDLDNGLFARLGLPAAEELESASS